MTIETRKTNKNTFHSIATPMFVKIYEGKIMIEGQQPEQQAELSVFDVKALYDMAYSKPSDSEEFRTIMAKAVKSDMAYRQQLKQNKYHGPFNSYDIEEEKNTKSNSGKAA